MQSKQDKKRVAVFGTLKVMVMSAMLTAMSVVIGIFCKSVLNFGNGLFRISLEGLPIILSGIMFGPVVGGLVGAAGDIISYFLSPQVYPINIVVTIGSAMLGAVSGIVSEFIIKKRGYAQIITASLSAHIIGSMIIKSAGLYTFYSWAVLWRIPLYAVISGVEIFLLCLLYKNKTFRTLISPE